MKGERIMQNEWIVISEYCDKCHIEPTFIDMLCESGLIDVEQGQKRNTSHPLPCRAP